MRSFMVIIRIISAVLLLSMATAQAGTLQEIVDNNRIMFDEKVEMHTVVMPDGSEYIMLRYHNTIPWASHLVLIDKARMETVEDESVAYKVLTKAAWIIAFEKITPEDMENLEKIRKEAEAIRITTGVIIKTCDKIYDFLYKIRNTYLGEALVMLLQNEPKAVRAFKNLNDIYDNAKIWNREATPVAEKLKGFDKDNIEQARKDIPKIIAGLSQLKKLNEELKRGLEKKCKPYSEACSRLSRIMGESRKYAILAIGVCTISNKACGPLIKKIGNMNSMIEHEISVLKSAMDEGNRNSLEYFSEWNKRNSAESYVYGTFAATITCIVGLPAAIYLLRRK